MLEAKNTKNNIFLTLTYDDDHLVPAVIREIDPDTGEIVSRVPEIPTYFDEKGKRKRLLVGVQGTLVPRDLTLFMKRLRKAWSEKGYTGIRFYACGEYGSKQYRPHYHLILFNCPVDDMELDTDKSQCEFPQWKSKEIEELWGKGRCRFSDVNFETCAYVARYMTKKIKGKHANLYYWFAGIEPEFSRMSRRPGIGRDFYELKKEILRNDDNIIIPGKGGIATVVRPPKYYDRLFDVDYPEDKEARSTRRRLAAESAKRVKMLKTSLTEAEQNALEERYLERRTKNLDLLF